MDDYAKIIGENIHNLRIRFGLTKEGLARDIGVSAESHPVFSGKSPAADVFAQSEKQSRREKEHPGGCFHCDDPVFHSERCDDLLSVDTGIDRQHHQSGRFDG